MKALITTLVLLIPVISVNTNVKAAIITAVASGNWDVPAVWDSGVVPACGDTIMVPAFIVVRIANNVDLNDAMDPLCPLVRLNVSGQILFNQGKKIRLAQGACVTVEFGGQLIPSPKGGGASEALRIGNVNWWQSSHGILNGYASLGCQIALPVTLSSFTIQEQGSAALISWSMDSEDEVEMYILEKSVDGQLWIELAVVNSRPTQSGPQNYSFLDEETHFSDVTYYRISAEMETGAIKVLQTEAWTPNFKAATSQLRIAPNPVNDESYISLVFDLDDAREVQFTIVNDLGQVIKQETVSLTNNNKITIDRAGLNTGHYLVSVSSENNIQLNSKLVIL